MYMIPNPSNLCKVGKQSLWGIRFCFSFASEFHSDLPWWQTDKQTERLTSKMPSFQPCVTVVRPKIRLLRAFVTLVVVVIRHWQSDYNETVFDIFTYQYFLKFSYQYRKTCTCIQLIMAGDPCHFNPFIIGILKEKYFYCSRMQLLQFLWDFQVMMLNVHV